LDKIYIIDAVNFLFRSYYAIGPMTNDQGQSTSAVYGFIRSVQKIIKEFSPHYLVCVFDGPDNKKSRQALFADYKMHRKGAPEDLFPQFEWAHQYCQLAGIPILCLEGIEADDTMASVAIWAEKKGAHVYLCSSDKDLTQLVNPHISVLHTHKNNLLIDAQGVHDLFGVRPDQMVDYLAIVGDASDNIPGLAHPEKVKGEKKQNVLREQQEIALMSRELARLDKQVEIPQEKIFYQLKEPQRKELSDFFHKMRFNSLLKELEETIQESSPTQTKTMDPEVASGEVYHLLDEEEELKAFFHRLNRESSVAIDTETSELSPMDAQLVGIGFCLEPGEAWYLPCRGKLGQEKVEKALRHFFAHTSCSFYGHNLKYDLHILENIHITVKKIDFDTLIASYLLNPQSRHHNLDVLALEKLNQVKIPIEDLIGKGKSEISMLDVPLDKVRKYCCEDVDTTARLKALFKKELKNRNLDSLFYDLELPLLPILQKMERRGIYLDIHPLEKIAASLHASLEKLKTAIFSLAQEEFNLNSPKQLSHILFEKLELKIPGKNRVEKSTSADVLEQLIQEHPIIAQILEYRGLEKLRSTYAEALPLSIHPQTHRIHCTFSQSVAATGRLSCQNPNLQNIPIKTPEGIAIRSCFKPQHKGWSFVGGDYSQIELRILAHFSQDPQLLHAFNSGQDIHTHTASLIFNLPAPQVTPEMRNQAKTVNFGILYGQGPFGLAQLLHISTKEASSFIKNYFERYPKVLDYLEFCKSEARRTGVAKTLLGRERPIPELSNKNPMIRAAAERLAINTPLQGTAADLIKKAMIQIETTLEEKQLKGMMILQIHDELIFEVPDEEISTFKHLVKEKMEKVIHLNVPIEVHIAVGKNWAEC
jgi:DNA polymerase-1